MRPSLRNLRFVARAITPPGRVRRFDTRFFAAWREDVAVALADGGPTNELEEIVWLPIAEAMQADIPLITRTVLQSVAHRLHEIRIWRPAARCRSTGWSARASSATCSERRRVAPPGILTAPGFCLTGSTPRPMANVDHLTEPAAMNGHPTSDGETGPEHTPWLSIAAAIASISVVGIAIGLGMPLLSVILETRGHSATMIGLNTAVAGLASIAAAPLATPLAMRFGVVWTMLAMIVARRVCLPRLLFRAVVLDVVSAARRSCTLR